MNIDMYLPQFEVGTSRQGSRGSGLEAIHLLVGEDRVKKIDSLVDVPEER